MFQQRSFVSCCLQCISNGVSAMLKLVYQQHSLLTSRLFFAYGVTVTHCFDIKTIFCLWYNRNTQKNLLFINSKPTDTNSSSSHRRIFTIAITKHLPLNRGIHQFILKSIFLFNRGIHQSMLKSIFLLTEGFYNCLC